MKVRKVEPSSTTGYCNECDDRGGKSLWIVTVGTMEFRLCNKDRVGLMLRLRK